MQSVYSAPLLTESRKSLEDDPNLEGNSAITKQEIIVKIHNIITSDHRAPGYLKGTCWDNSK